MVLSDADNACLCVHIYLCTQIYLDKYTHTQYCYVSFYQLSVHQIAFSVVAKFTNPAPTPLEASGLTRNPGDFLPDPHPDSLSLYSWRGCLQMELGLKVTLLSKCRLASAEIPSQKRCCTMPSCAVAMMGTGVERGERGGMQLAKSPGLLINKLWHCFSSPLWWRGRLDTHCVRDCIYVLCKPGGDCF